MIHSGSNFRYGGDDVENETLAFALPEGIYACDMAVFTIWCRLASTHFTGIDISPTLFVSVYYCSLIAVVTNSGNKKHKTDVIWYPDSEIHNKNTTHQREFPATYTD